MSMWDQGRVMCLRPPFLQQVFIEYFYVLGTVLNAGMQQ